MDCHFLLFQPWTLKAPPNYYRPSWQLSRIAQQQIFTGYWSCCALIVKRSIMFCVPFPSLRQPSTPRIFLSTHFVASRRVTATSALPGLQDGFKVELDRLLAMLPQHIKERLQDHPKLPQLIEIVMDLGRHPMARFPFGDCTLSESVIAMSDLEQVVSLVGDFDEDNRAGIDRTLHRISAIRSRDGQIVGLTCRVGRAISGSAEIVRDLVSSGGSLLLMGPPGVGKTTAIREIARVLADECNRRVVIVDTSNEIAGEGDIPHSGIGRARRMQVPNVDMQHEVMIEAIENHMPQTIVIDEIGTELEALAAGTIAQRGVQLVGTAHGMAIENLIKNPSLQMLAGGIQSVTIGDDEARRRRIHKSVLERKGPPTFTAAAEMLSWNEWRIHWSLSATVDALLSGRTPQFQVRRMIENGQVIIVKSDTIENPSDTSNVFSLGYDMDPEDSGDEMEDDNYNEYGDNIEQLQHRGDAPLVLYCYQIRESDLEQVMEVMALENEVQLTNNIGAADAVLTLHSKLKQNSWIQDIARLRQIPVFLIKANTMAQMVRALRAILGLETLDTCNFLSSIQVKDGVLRAEGTSSWQYSDRKTTTGDQADALEEARLAVERIVIPKGQPVELLPRSLHIMALQVKLVESYQLMTERVGTEVNLRLRILPVYINSNQSGISDVSDEDCKDYFSGGFGMSGTSVRRLPILPEYNRNYTNST